MNYDTIGERSPWWVPVIGGLILAIGITLAAIGIIYAVGETVEQRTPDSPAQMKGHGK